MLSAFGRIDTYIKGYGVISATSNTYHIYSTTSGIVEEVLFYTGENVSRNQTLFKYNTASLEMSTEKITSDLEGIEAELIQRNLIVDYIENGKNF